MTKLWTVLCLMGLTNTAYAQSFSTTTTGQQIGPDANCNNAATQLNLPITVSGVGTIDDLNLGFQATSTYRGDFRIRLTSPAATTVTLVNPGNSSQSNYNFEMDDTATDVINTGAHTTNDGTTAPPYENLVRTNNAGGGGLSSFTGENANGTWTLNVCDNYNLDQGNFGIATLYFANLSDADLRLTSTIDNAYPQETDTVTLTYTLSNTGPNSTTGVTSNITLPSGLNFGSASGDGTYNSGTGLWNLPGTLANGSTSTMTITATVLATGGTTVTSEILTSNQNDPDSTPGNGSTDEDDDNSLSFFVQPSAIPPALNCPISEQFTHSWDAPGATNGWDSGDTINSYTAGGENLTFTISGDTPNLGQINGTDSPVTQNGYTGGITPAEYSLAIAADHGNSDQEIVITADLGIPSEGVEGVQFSVFDIDLGGWVDRLTVTGEINGITVMPTTMTPNTNNYVIGNSAIGRNGNAQATSASGNVTVTFASPVDKVIISYGNDPSAGADPAFQIMSLHEITMCPRLLADLSASKSVEPVVAGAYMTPGSEVLYKITVNNSAVAEAPANDLDLTDILPDTVKFMSATTTGFTGGTFSNPALPTANTDCDSGACVIHFEGGTLPIDTTGEIIVTALIK